MLEIRAIATLRLQLLVMKTQADLMFLWAHIQAPKQRELKMELQDILQADPQALKAHLLDKNVLQRMTAMQAIHNRRIHLEPELIGCLSDPQPIVRQAARQALVRLSRGADFGPKPNAGPTARHKAVARWKAWLAMQSAAADNTPPPLVADPLEAEADRLAVELIQAAKDKETAVLQQLQATPEPLGTLALAAAVRELKDQRLAKAREALAARMAALDGDELEARLSDDDPAIRGAALVAAGKNRTKQAIPDALKLLEDPDPAVALAARTALKQLTKQDFGPPANAAPVDRAIAVGRWYEWWVKTKERN